MSDGYRKKLIEVALPLQAINYASAHEKEIKVGKPTSVHLWWSRKPLATCRAVLFASLVEDPSARPEEFPTEEAQERERQRLFRIIEQLVKWENSNNHTVLTAAKAEIMRCTGNSPPPLLDPFCGGGSIPLEAQRLGLEAHGRDLNPVAVLITKALIEIPPRFAGHSPVNPEARRRLLGEWKGARGLAEDVRYYGHLMRDEAQKRTGHVYPKVRLPIEQGGGEAMVIAWLWARTVKCPNPACGAQMPLTSKWWLSTKKRKEVWVEPVIDRSGSPPTVSFEVRQGGKPSIDGTVNRRGAVCTVCSTPVPFSYIRDEGKAGRMGEQLMAVVAEGNRGRVYLSPTEGQSEVARSAQPEWAPESALPEQALGFRVQQYGMTRHADLFTPRQLIALTTFTDLVAWTRTRVLDDARTTGMSDDATALDDGGTGACGYADAIATYLACAVDRIADWGSRLSRWESNAQVPQQVFGGQAIAMAWEFAEANPLSASTGSFQAAVANIARSLDALPELQERAKGSRVGQSDSTAALHEPKPPLISTDPPYYDNIGYADLSDFFYVWLRRSLAGVYPKLLSTVLVPKSGDLLASPYRFDGDRSRANRAFEEGLTHAFENMRRCQHPNYLTHTHLRDR